MNGFNPMNYTGLGMVNSEMGGDDQRSNLLNMGLLGSMIGGEGNPFSSQMMGLLPLVGMLGDSFAGKDNNDEPSTAGAPGQNVNIPGSKNKSRNALGGIVSNMPIGLLGNALSSVSPLGMLFSKLR